MLTFHFPPSAEEEEEEKKSFAEMYGWLLFSFTLIYHIQHTSNKTRRSNIIKTYA